MARARVRRVGVFFSAGSHYIVFDRGTEGGIKYYKRSSTGASAQRVAIAVRQLATGYDCEPREVDVLPRTCGMGWTAYCGPTERQK